MQEAIHRLRADATRVGGCVDFTELAAVTLARHFLRKGRKLDARRVLRAYLRQRPPTSRISAAMAMSV